MVVKMTDSLIPTGDLGGLARSATPKAIPNQVDASGETSDGFHTFNELYEHRTQLFIALMFAYPERSWFSSQHEDGSMWDGFFIAGMHLPTGDITYHLENKYRHAIAVNRRIMALAFAPKWDGHSPQDVVTRLARWNDTRYDQETKDQS